jgi:hypothetical protein
MRRTHRVSDSGLTCLAGSPSIFVRSFTSARYSLCASSTQNSRNLGCLGQAQNILATPFTGSSGKRTCAHCVASCLSRLLMGLATVSPEALSALAGDRCRVVEAYPNEQNRELDGSHGSLSGATLARGRQSRVHDGTEEKRPSLVRSPIIVRCRARPNFHSCDHYCTCVHTYLL